MHHLSFFLDDKLINKNDLWAGHGNGGKVYGAKFFDKSLWITSLDNKLNMFGYESNIVTKNSHFSDLSKKVEKFDVSDNPREDIKKLKEFSEKWNSIGFVPKQDIQIKDKFDKVISSLYNKLKVDKSEKKTIQFQIKAERLKGNSDKLNVEKELIREEIGKVNKTILQYENNISFFGNGKGTEKLKEDVLKNIENSKKEIEELKKKLSLLNKI